MNVLRSRETGPTPAPRASWMRGYSLERDRSKDIRHLLFGERGVRGLLVLTDLNVEANMLRDLQERFFKCRKGVLDKASSRIWLESLRAVVDRVSHPILDFFRALLLVFRQGPRSDVRKLRRLFRGLHVPKHRKWVASRRLHIAGIHEL